MSSSDKKYLRYKPADVSKEEWEDIISDLEERKVDNSNHQTVQIKLRNIVKYVLPILSVPFIILATFLATQYQAIVYGIVGVIFVIAFIYLFAVEVGAGQ